MTEVPPCPWCKTRKKVYNSGPSLRQFVCLECGRGFDDDPSEGGDYSDRNPAARLERAEVRQKKSSRRR